MPGVRAPAEQTAPMKPVLFISHSSTDRARAQALVDAIEARQQFTAAFDVRDLRHGEEYAPQLFHWLARCHGGVLLLTAHVMKNAPWVLQEATVLRARARLEGQAFRLFVVIDADVLDSRIWKTWFAPLKLDALQRLKLVARSEVVDGAFTPAELTRVVDAIHVGMDGLADAGDDFFARLSRLVAAQLAPLLQHQVVCDGLADALQVQDAQWEQLMGGGAALQALIARRLCTGDFSQLNGIEGLFRKFGPLLVSKVPELLQLHGTLGSYWVPLPSGARVVEALESMREAGGPVAADRLPPNLLLVQVHGGWRQDAVARKLAERLLVPYTNGLGQWRALAAGKEGQAGLRDRVARTLRGIYKGNPGLADADVIRKRGEALCHPSSPNPTFVRVSDAVSLEHMLPVAREFWSCLFIVTAAPGPCAEMAAAWGVDPIVHPPGAQTEQDCLDDVDAAMELLVPAAAGDDEEN